MSPDPQVYMFYIYAYVFGVWVYVFTLLSVQTGPGYQLLQFLPVFLRFFFLKQAQTRLIAPSVESVHIRI